MQARILAVWWTKDQISEQVYKVPNWYFSNCIHSTHWRGETQTHSSLCVGLWSCHFILSIKISKNFFLLLQSLVTFFINWATASFIFTLNIMQKIIYTVHHVHAVFAEAIKVLLPRTEITNSCELPCSAENQVSPLGEKVLLIAKPFFQPQI